MRAKTLPRAMTEEIVCGAGTAGLASAAALRAAGVEVVVLEQTDRVGASWRTRYDDLRLNTPGWMSTQPGYRASRRRYGEYPPRDAWIRYLEDYAAHHRIDVRFGTQVRRLEPADEEWRLVVVPSPGHRRRDRDLCVAQAIMGIPPIVASWRFPESTFAISSPSCPAVDELDATIIRPARKSEPDKTLHFAPIRSGSSRSLGPARTSSPSSAVALAPFTTCASASPSASGTGRMHRAHQPQARASESRPGSTTSPEGMEATI